MNETVTWSTIAEHGGIDAWVQTVLRAQHALDEDVLPSRLSAAELKRYKQRREHERQLRRDLKRQAWHAYRTAHLVHLGNEVFYHDLSDVDRYDLPELDARRQSNALPELADAQALARALELEMPQLRWLAFHREVERATHYHLWTIPKRDGSERLISAPKPQLKRVQHWILRQIAEHLPVHGAAHGFLPGRSVASNAAVHAGAEIIVKLDIRDFYPSIHWRRLKGLMRKAGYGEQVATLLALLCSEPPREVVLLKGQKHYVATGARALPQGAPTSPALSNALCLRLDCRLSTLATRLGLRYTRYADDLTFSACGEARKQVGTLLKAVSTIVTAEGFALHPDKQQILRPGRRQAVTGLVVNRSEHTAAVRVPRRFVRRLRAALHNRAHGRGEATLAQLRGWIAWLHMVEPDKAQPYWDQLRVLEQKQAGS